jgi:hypothetical protein
MYDIKWDFALKSRRWNSIHDENGLENSITPICRWKM